MGYAHDIFLARDFDRRAFAAAVEDIRTLIRRTEFPVAGLEGRPGTMPVLEDDHISFSGVNYNCVCPPGVPEIPGCSSECSRGSWDRDHSFGTFHVNVGPGARLSRFHKDRYWFDCKTRRKPYSVLAMAAMIALKHHLGNSVVMRSKGSWGIEWCRGGYYTL